MPSWRRATCSRAPCWCRRYPAGVEDLELLDDPTPVEDHPAGEADRGAKTPARGLDLVAEAYELGWTGGLRHARDVLRDEMAGAGNTPEVVDAVVRRFAQACGLTLC